MWILQTSNNLLNKLINVFDEKYHSFDAFGVICRLGFLMNTKHFKNLFSFHDEANVWDKPASQLLDHVWSRKQNQISNFFKQTSVMDNDEYKGTDFTRYVKTQIKIIYSSAGTIPESPMPSITNPNTKYDVEQRKPTCIYFRIHAVIIGCFNSLNPSFLYYLLQDLKLTKQCV
jgi:hypothetical protein